MDRLGGTHGRMMAREWSYPSLNLPPQNDSRPPPWTRWALIVLGTLSILGLAPVIFCLVLIAMGAMTLLIELLPLISAASLLIVGVVLLGTWGMSYMLPPQWRTIVYMCDGGLVAVDGIFGFAIWIVMILQRENIRDPLDLSSGILLGRERIIAGGFASWALVVMAQIAFIISLNIHSSRQKFDLSTQIRSSALSSTGLSTSNSVIPMRRATIHHHSSITSPTPSRFSHRPAKSWTSPSTSHKFSPSTTSTTTMPIADLSSPFLNSQSPVPNFPFPTTLSSRSTDPIPSHPVAQVGSLHSSDPLTSFAFRDSILRSSPSLPIFPGDHHPPTTAKKLKRNSALLKSLTIDPESHRLRKNTSVSSLPTPTLPSMSSRKWFKSVDDSIHSGSDVTVWDDWNPGDEDPRIRERVEMSFESVRLEKSEPSSPRLLGISHGRRNVSTGSAASGLGVERHAEIGLVSLSNLSKGGFKWP